MSKGIEPSLRQDVGETCIVTWGFWVVAFYYVYKEKMLTRQFTTTVSGLPSNWMYVLLFFSG